MTVDPLPQLEATTGEEDRDWIALDFMLAQVDPKVKEAVFAAAVPHWFDYDLLCVLLGNTIKLTKKAYRNLLSLSFVEPFPERGYNIHESTRFLILKRLGLHKFELLRKYSRVAAKYFHYKKQRGDSWVIEGIYHSTVAGEVSFSYLMDYGLTNLSKYKNGEIETLCRTILECTQFIKLPKEIVAVCFYLLGKSYSDFGKTAAAKEIIRLALEQKIKHDFFNARCWAELADIEYTLDERTFALRHYRKALAFHDRNGDDYFAAGCLLSMANLFLVEGEDRKAISSANRALRRFEKIDSLDGVAGCNQFLGMVALYRNKVKLAGDRYSAALEQFRNTRFLPGIINCSIGLAKVDIRRGDFASARKLIKSALRNANKIRYTTLYADAQYVDALLEYHLGQHDKAETKALEAVRLFEEIGDEYRESDVWTLLADIYEAKNELEKALSSATKAHRLFQSSSKRTWPSYSDRIADLKSALKQQKKSRG